MSRTGSVLAAIVGAVSIFAGSSTIRAGNGPTIVWDVRDATQAGQLLIYNADDAGCALGEPVGSGDFDGDGYADVVTCAFYGPAGPANDRLAAGKLHIWFGGPHALDGGVVYNAEHPTAPTVEIWGPREGDFLGCEVDVGDVNGDGLADILVCAENSDGFGADASREQAGSLFVIFGRASWPSSIDLANDPEGVVQVLGANSGDRCGFWTTTGDVTGDGTRDILVSADLVKGPDNIGGQRGAVYVIPGGPSLPSQIDLASSQTRADLGIVSIFGVDQGDHFGASLATGDFDGDGLVDIVIGAGLARSGAGYSGYGMPNGQAFGGADGPSNDRENAGQAYVLFGRTSWEPSIQMSDTPAADTAVYFGDQPDGSFGEESKAGDIDGDGKDDLAIGALTADAPGRPGSGIGYIFWSGAIQRGVAVDVRTAGGNVMTQIYGQESGDIGADTMLIADVDADGLADILFGSPTNSPVGRDSAGDLKVIYGSRTPLPAVVDTAAPPVPIFRLIPADQGDLFTYSVAVGDVDGDGVTDLVPNVMAGDGLGNRHPEAGDAVVISGRALAARAGRGGFVAPELTSVTIDPQQPTYYAGQSGLVLTLTSNPSDPARSFRQGAVALLRGTAVPTTFVSESELTVRLDDALDIRNTAGPIDVQVRNPGTEPSAVVSSIVLIGPAITKVKMSKVPGGFQLKVRGTDFLAGATIEAFDQNGAPVAVTSLTLRKGAKLKGRIQAGSVVRRSTLTVRVVNPGPAPSPTSTVTVP